ncbi:MAG TPA: glycosyltransferase family protein [Chitinophagaceae bacterium]|jgi:spore coat polysaccharide biosynthesis protein SpsF|nr:glycosyltransferase family protein [Chitinophagaceae bacterium]
MKIIAITQARYGSSRLRGKVLEKVAGKELLTIHLERAKRSKKIEKLIVATTDEPEAHRIVQLAMENKCGVYRGSLTDVLDRYYQAAKKEAPDYVVRITSDCPLIDAEIIDEIIDCCIRGGFDYCSNTLHRTFPDGEDVEIFRFIALERAWKEAVLQSDREHVTPYIWRNSTVNGRSIFTSYNYSTDEDFSGIRITVDEPADLQLIQRLILALGDDKGWKDYVHFLMKNPEVMDINAHIKGKKIL